MMEVPRHTSLVCEWPPIAMLQHVDSEDFYDQARLVGMPVHVHKFDHSPAPMITTYVNGVASSYHGSVTLQHAPLPSALPQPHTVIHLDQAPVAPPRHSVCDMCAL
jgi:hypothetical protein